MKRLRAFYKMVFVVSVLVMVLTVGRGFAAELQPMKVSYLPIIDLLQIYVAWEKGFFEGEGIKVEGQAVQSGSMTWETGVLLKLLNWSGWKERKNPMS